MTVCVCLFVWWTRVIIFIGENDNPYKQNKYKKDHVYLKGNWKSLKKKLKGKTK